MRDDLLLYYERELSYLRQMGAQFATRYPRIASRLSLEPSRCEDPHVERLLEAFAFLTARIHLRLDDDFPEITESLLEVVYPHLVRPVPSMSIVEFEVDPTQGRLTTGQVIPRGTFLYSKPVAGLECKFSTTYDTTLWPVSVTAVQWLTADRLPDGTDAKGCPYAVRLQLTSPSDIPLRRIGIDRLRLHVAGESQFANTVYEVLTSRLGRIVVRAPLEKGPGTILPASCFVPVGFEESEYMFPYPRRSFQGYRLLQEFFTFPEKFHFFDITGLRSAFSATSGNTADLFFLVSGIRDEQEGYRLQNGLNASAFRLNCTPVVNLFPQTAEPILLDQRKPEYAVVPDIRRHAALEVFSIESVSTIVEGDARKITYRPFYSHRSDTGEDDSHVFWKSHRRASLNADDEGTEVSISLVDNSMRPRLPDVDHLTVKTLCTNRDQPSRLPFGNPAGDFEVEQSFPIKRILTLRKPTPTTRLPRRAMAQWHLISHLSLNYLSLIDEGREALQQILRLYDFGDSPVIEKMIAGISRLDSRAEVARVALDSSVTFARGKRIEIEFDEEQFVGGGAYLFASVLERFFGLYASLNSFTQLAAYSSQRREVMREWPPRAGRRMLL